MIETELFQWANILMAAEEEAVQRMTVNRQKINSILIQLYR